MALGLALARWESSRQRDLSGRLEVVSVADDAVALRGRLSKLLQQFQCLLAHHREFALHSNLLEFLASSSSLAESIPVISAAENFASYAHSKAAASNKANLPDWLEGVVRNYPDAFEPVYLPPLIRSFIERAESFKNCPALLIHGGGQQGARLQSSY